MVLLPSVSELTFSENGFFPISKIDNYYRSFIQDLLNVKDGTYILINNFKFHYVQPIVIKNPWTKEKFVLFENSRTSIHNTLFK